MFQEVKDKLDKVGCGFCLAKWTQVTMHLQLGHTHSCHHPYTHKIPLDELRNNPSALHNTQYKKERRKEMLEGGRPHECGYCWSVEDNSSNFSDRVYKSQATWSNPYFDEITKLDWNANYNPKYVEVSFSNACNFKCSYCGPEYSSKWMEEIENHGPYPTTSLFNNLEYLTSNNKEIIKHSDFNPYVESFWKWWPDLYNDLDTFRITGGEPLMSKDTWKVLDYIIESPNPNRNLNLAINSNLGVPDKLIDKLITKLNLITDKGNVKSITLFTSVDTWGKQAEYIRHGLQFNRFWDNINKILTKCPTVFLTFMSTYNALSVPNYSKFLNEVYKLKKEYSKHYRYILLDISHLIHPPHQTIKILPEIFFEEVKQQGEYIETLLKKLYKEDKIEYTNSEVDKLKRIHDWMVTEKNSSKLLENQYNFGKFIEEHDKRRNTNFIKVFPELAEFYKWTKTIKLNT